MPGWLPTMDESLKFGELLARELAIGDIVEWSKWNEERDDWDTHYGLIIEIKNEIKNEIKIEIKIK